MAVNDIDFEGTKNADGNLNVDTNTVVPDNKDDVTHLNDSDVADITNDSTTNNVDEPSNQTNDTDDNPSTGELVVGDQIEVDGVIYTVAENGNLVDDKGNIFKEAKDIEEWLKSVNVKDKNDTEPLSLAYIQEAVGIKVTDENGKPVEFTETPEGVKSYIDSVIELRSNELQEAAINRLYQDNPLLKQFQDYVQIKGTPRGFGELPDRSGIKLDKNNETQLIAVIKMAAEEFGNKSLNDNYIKYLRDSGGLYDEAANQLAALVDKDKAYRNNIETQAAAKREAESQRLKEYWENVNRIIISRAIGGYKIPETFTKEVDGKKVVITPNDFFNFVAIASYEDESGNRITGYQNALNGLTDEEYMNRELLDAWLMFTGGTYKDLIDMAVKENEVRKLIVKSKESRSAKTVRVVKKQTGKTNINDIVL